MNDKNNTKNRTFSLLKTIGSTAVKAGNEALKKKLNFSGDGDFSISAAALRLTKGLDELKGAAMKMGQIMSMMDDNLLPKGWKEALSKLQAEATAKDWSEIEPILLQEYGNLNAFSHIDKTSIHAASIGQVHTALLKNGQKVAIKVQYPGLEANIKSDLVSMKKLIKLANIMPNMANYDHLFNAAEDMFKQELDFVREKNFYLFYHDHFNSSENIIIPKPVEELCTPKVLVTQWVEGLNLQKWIDNFELKKTKSSEDLLQRDKLGALLMEVIFSELLLLNHIQSDPNPGNFLVTPDNKLVLLDFGATQKLNAQLVENYTRLFLAGLEGKRGELLQIAKKMDFIETGDTDLARDAFVHVMQIVLEPFASENYSWQDCALTKRVNSESMVYMKQTKFRAPSGEVLFLNRRLVGNVLMLEKLGPTFNAREILMRLLKQRDEKC